MKMSEWDEAAAQLTQDQQTEIIQALETLKGWEPFKKEFSWTCMFVLQTTLEYIPAKDFVKTGAKKIGKFCTCEFGKTATGEFVDDDQCTCGVKRHHYHCTHCGCVTQVG